MAKPRETKRRKPPAHEADRPQRRPQRRGDAARREGEAEGDQADDFDTRRTDPAAPMIDPWIDPRDPAMPESPRRGGGREEAD